MRQDLRGSFTIKIETIEKATKNIPHDVDELYMYSMDQMMGLLGVRKGT